ncbi:MAG: hypothetical protein FJZ01_04150 [Candidatus Sericytochromatia bacterium]|nr:hypothetical protein [Candidatus Tanganyikabacteria bacterium]
MIHELADQFMPHGMCFLWQPWLIAAVVGFNSLIALAYYATAGIILVFFGRRPDVPNPLLVSLFLFSTFFLCGTTHVMDIVTIWWPFYWTDAMLDGLTATAAVATIVVLGMVIPQLLRSGTVEDYLEARSKQVLSDKAAALEEANRNLARLNEDLQQQAALTDRATELLANREERIRDLRAEVAALEGKLQALAHES